MCMAALEDTLKFVSDYIICVLFQLSLLYRTCLYLSCYSLYHVRVCSIMFCVENVLVFVLLRFVS